MAPEAADGRSSGGGFVDVESGAGSAPRAVGSVEPGPEGGVDVAEAPISIPSRAKSITIRVHSGSEEMGVLLDLYLRYLNGDFSLHSEGGVRVYKAFTDPRVAAFSETHLRGLVEYLQQCRGSGYDFDVEHEVGEL